MFKRRPQTNPETQQTCAATRRKQAAAANTAAYPLTWQEQSLARPLPGPRPISQCSPIRPSAEADPRDKR